MDSTVECDPCKECDPSDGTCSMDKSAGTQCAEPTCNEDGDLVQAAVCNDSGDCQDPSTMDCGAYQCVNPGNAMAMCPNSCAGDEDCKAGNFCFDRPDDNDGDEECYENRPPEADAGMDKSRVPPGDPVNLNGANSSDPDGDEITFQWRLADSTCPGNETSDTEDHRQDLQNDPDWNPTDERVSFTMPEQDCEDEVLEFELVVDDGEFESEPDTVAVAYGNCEDKPTANIERPSDGDIQWGDTVTLDGSGSTVGCGSSLTYSWDYDASGAPELSEPSGSAEETYELKLPDVCRESTTRYEVQLQVDDEVRTSRLETFPLVVEPNGPCEGDEAGDAGIEDAGGGGEISGSSCGGCSVGSDNEPRLPVSVVGVLLVGGLLRMRRRRE